MQTQNNMTRQQRRALKRKFGKACARTDRCGLDCCGAPVTSILPTVVVEDIVTGRSEIWHVHCLSPAQNETKKVTGVHATFSAKDPHIEVDRVWFDTHPGVDAYVRAPQDEEWLAIGIREKLTTRQHGFEVGPEEIPPVELQQIIVFQKEPGQRARLRFIGLRSAAEAGLASGEIALNQFYSNDDPAFNPTAATIITSANLKAFGVTERDVFDDAEEMGAAMREKAENGVVIQ